MVARAAGGGVVVQVLADAIATGSLAAGCGAALPAVGWVAQPVYACPVAAILAAEAIVRATAAERARLAVSAPAEIP